VAPGIGFILVSKDKEMVLSVKTADLATNWIENFQKAILREHEAKGKFLVKFLVFIILERRERALQVVNDKLGTRVHKIATNEVVSGISQVSHDIK
jgi:hypothetical protein